MEAHSRRCSMKKIIISGEIGFEVWPDMIRSQLSDAKGGDIEFDLSSPGGFVFDGIEIYNMIRDYKRDNPKSQMILNIKSEAASMGSYIATNPAFDLVTAEDNASYMIHNPLMGTIGDYQEMQKSADFLERLAAMMAPSYANRSKQSIEETRASMDSETWLFGEEIVKAGFADEMMKTDSKEGKAAARAKAELKYKAVAKKIKEKEFTADEFEKAVAMIAEPQPEKKPSEEPAPGGKNNQEDIKVKNIDELKEKFPEIHTAAMKIHTAAMKAGADQEKEVEKKRLETLIAMKAHDDFKDIPQALERIDKGIVMSETVSQVELGLMSVLRSPAVKAVMDSNDIGDINPGEVNTPSGEVKVKSHDENKGEF